MGLIRSHELSRDISRDGSRCHIQTHTENPLIYLYSRLFYKILHVPNRFDDIFKEPIHPTRIHEHNFISIRTEKGQTSILCSTCRSLYCEKCGKLVTISDQNYMQYNIYN